MRLPDTEEMVEFQLTGMTVQQVGSGPLRPRWASWLGRFYRQYFKTLRVRLLLPNGSWTTPEDFSYSSILAAHFEADILSLAGVLANARFSVLVAGGRDGDRASSALAAFGTRAFRSSTGSRVSLSLRQLIRHAQRHAGPVAVSVDGPLGPAGRPKPGIISCALHTGRPILPVGVGATRKIAIPRTWAGLYFPAPASRVVIALGRPLRVEAPLSWKARQALCRDLQGRLLRQRSRATDALRAPQAESA